MGFAILFAWSILWAGSLLVAAATASRWTAPKRRKIGVFVVAALGAVLAAPFMLDVIVTVVVGERGRSIDGLRAIGGFFSLPYGPLGFLQSLRMAPFLSFGSSFEVVRFGLLCSWTLSSLGVVAAFLAI